MTAHSLLRPLLRRPCSAPNFYLDPELAAGCSGRRPHRPLLAEGLPSGRCPPALHGDPWASTVGISSPHPGRQVCYCFARTLPGKPHLERAFRVLTQRQLGPACLNLLFSIPSSDGVPTLPRVHRKGTPIPFATEVLSYSLHFPSRPHAWSMCSWSPNNRPCVPSSPEDLSDQLWGSEDIPGSPQRQSFSTPVPARPCSLHLALMSTLWLESGQKGSRKVAENELQEVWRGSG